MKIHFTILLLLLTIGMNAQSYHQNLFDEMGYDTSIGVSDATEQYFFSHNESGHMEALVLMYENTNDLNYAQTLIKCIGNVIDRRDDLRGSLQGYSNIEDYKGVVGKTWATDYYNEDSSNSDAYAHLLHSANITYPMAKFAAMVHLNSSLHNIYSSSGGRYGSKKFIDIADSLILRVDETLEHHDNEWRSSGNRGWYVEESGVDVPVVNAGGILPLNKLSAVGRTILHMYRATQQQTYLDKVYKLANFIKHYTDDSSDGVYKEWRYWEYNDQSREDVGHAGVTVSFPYECYKYNISYSGTQLYTSTYMTKYAKTFTEGVYRSPLEIHEDVEVFNTYWNFKTNQKSSGIDPVSHKNHFCCDRWLKLSQFDRRIYQIVADLYKCSNFTSQIHSGTSAYTIAHLACFDNQLLPTNSDHGWGSGSDWSGVACGNFDSDDEDEFVVVRNYNGQFYTKQLYNDGFSSVTNNKYYGSSYKWA